VAVKREGKRKGRNTTSTKGELAFQARGKSVLRPKRRRKGVFPLKETGPGKTFREGKRGWQASQCGKKMGKTLGSDKEKGEGTPASTGGGGEKKGGRPLTRPEKGTVNQKGKKKKNKPREEGGANSSLHIRQKREASKDA